MKCDYGTIRIKILVTLQQSSSLIIMVFPAEASFNAAPQNCNCLVLFIQLKSAVHLRAPSSFTSHFSHSGGLYFEHDETARNNMADNELLLY